MMTIKVRAYHKELKRMISTNELVKDQMTLLADGRFINVSGVDSRLSQIVPRDRMIPLLFTGLFDKNKKEIYEGDILRFKGRVDGNNREFILPVTFEIRGGFQMYLTGIRHYDIFSNEVEVIGNVFEDKNL